MDARKKIIALFAVSALLILVLYFYTVRNVNNETLPTESKPTVVLGWIGPLTGAASVLGVDNLRAVQLALSEYQANKKPSDPSVKFFYADDAYNFDLSVSHYKEMIATEKPDAIIVTAYSSVKLLAPLALKDNVLLIDPIDNDNSLASINHNVFLIAKETEGLAGVDANAIIAAGKKNTAVIYYGDDDFMPTLANTLTKILSSAGNKITLFKYKAGTTDFNEYLKWCKSHDVDSYVFFGYAEIGFAMKQARELGIKAAFYSVNVITDSTLQKNSQGAIEGTYFAHFTSLDGNITKADEFKRKYVERYHQLPTLEWTALQAYDATNIFLQAVGLAAHSPPDSFRENLRLALLKTTSYQGVSGTISIKLNGASRGIFPSLYIMTNGKPVATLKK